MHGNRIAREDIVDSDFVDASELGSDGSASYFSLPLISISAGGVFTVDTSGMLRGIISEPGGTIEILDKVFVTGASPGAADGYYTIAELITESTFDVLESTVAATGGTVQFLYASGAGKVGFDSAGLNNTSADNVQDAISDLDFAVTGGGITEGVHETLDTLVHNIAEDSFEEATYTGIFNRLTNVTIYTDATKTTKVRETSFTYTGPRITTVTTIQYDGAGVVKNTLTEAITYIGPFSNRVDNITRTKT